MHKSISYQRMRAVGQGIVIGTLGGITFAVIGVYIGPGALIATLLALGIGLVSVANVLERRALRQAKEGAA